MKKSEYKDFREGNRKALINISEDNSKFASLYLPRCNSIVFNLLKEIEMYGQVKEIFQSEQEYYS